MADFPKVTQAVGSKAQVRGQAAFVKAERYLGSITLKYSISVPLKEIPQSELPRVTGPRKYVKNQQMYFLRACRCQRAFTYRNSGFAAHSQCEQEAGWSLTSSVFRRRSRGIGASGDWPETAQFAGTWARRGSGPGPRRSRPPSPDLRCPGAPGDLTGLCPC